MLQILKDKRKGFVYSIIFGAFLALFLLIAVYYTQTVAENDLSVEYAENIEKRSCLYDDLVTDVMDMMEFRARVDHGPSATYVIFEDKLPSKPKINMTQAFDDWEFYIDEVYEGKVNENITLNTTYYRSVPRAYIDPFECYYKYDDIKKTEAVFYGEDANIRNYTIDAVVEAKLTSVKDKDWDWSDDPTNLYVVINIQDFTGSAVFVDGRTEGYVEPDENNEAELKFAGNKRVYINAGGYPGHGESAFRISSTAAATHFNLTAGLVGDEPTSVWLPIGVNIQGNEDSYAVVASG